MRGEAMTYWGTGLAQWARAADRRDSSRRAVPEDRRHAQKPWLRRFPAASAILLAALAGCTKPAPPAPPPPAPPPMVAHPGPYDCRLTEGRTTTPLHVAIGPDGPQSYLTLRVGLQDTTIHTLNAVEGTGGLVFADAAYAWRAGGATGVLTDITKVLTYNCAAQSAAPAPAK
jgi:hypothetical protein